MILIYSAYRGRNRRISTPFHTALKLPLCAPSWSLRIGPIWPFRILRKTSEDPLRERLTCIRRIRASLDNSPRLEQCHSEIFMQIISCTPSQIRACRCADPTSAGDCSLMDPLWPNAAAPHLESTQYGVPIEFNCNIISSLTLHRNGTDKHSYLNYRVLNLCIPHCNGQHTRCLSLTVQTTFLLDHWLHC